LQHNRDRLLGELGVLLQEAVEPQEPASFRVVAEPLGTHPFNMIAHQIAEDAAELRQLAEPFERAVRLRSKQRPQDRLATSYAVLSAQLRDRIAGDRPFLHEEVEESIDHAGTMENRGS
jgi:hypothetical protein